MRLKPGMTALHDRNGARMRLDLGLEVLNSAYGAIIRLNPALVCRLSILM